MAAAPGMLLNTGKKLKEACAAVPYLRDSRAIVTHPINIASSKKGQQLLSLFSTTFFFVIGLT